MHKTAVTLAGVMDPVEGRGRWRKLCRTTQARTPVTKKLLHGACFEMKLGLLPSQTFKY